MLKIDANLSRPENGIKMVNDQQLTLKLDCPSP